MKLRAESFVGVHYLAVALTIAATLSVLLALRGSRANSLVGDCVEKREWCIDSCYKQRQNCDKNNSSDYCVKQDQRCQKACEDAFRKCSEKP